LGALGLAFTDVTAASGIAWTAFSPSTLEGGGGFVDLDGDALPDVVTTAYGTSADSPHVGAYLNLGDGTFEDVTVALGLEVYGLAATSVTSADIDNDGDADLLFTARDGSRLFRNDGAAGFVDVSVASGVADQAWSAAAAFGDFDGDGWVDLYLGNYILVANYPAHTGLAEPAAPQRRRRRVRRRHRGQRHRWQGRDLRGSVHRLRRRWRRRPDGV
jgi:hypothetical protein